MTRALVVLLVLSCWCSHRQRCRAARARLYCTGGAELRRDGASVWCAR